jgi:hypothetical protein
MESRSRISPGDSECSGAASFCCPAGSEQQLVEGLHQVVARLVHCVDGALEARDVRVGRIRVARLVFLVPQIVVGAVEREHKLHQIGRRMGVRCRIRWEETRLLRRRPARCQRSVVSSCSRVIWRASSIAHGGGKKPDRPTQTVSAPREWFQSCFMRTL